jgi:hypothetical protein
VLHAHVLQKTLAESDERLRNILLWLIEVSHRVHVACAHLGVFQRRPTVQSSDAGQTLWLLGQQWRLFRNLTQVAVDLLPGARGLSASILV